MASVERVTVEYPGDASGTGVSGPVTTGSVSDDPLDPGGGGNTLDDTMAALNPTLDYDASETGGVHFNLGSAGSLNVEPDPQFGSNDPWVLCPGVVRGAPATYAFDCAYVQVTAGWASSSITPANLPASTGWTTGTWNCFMIRFSQSKGDDWSFLNVCHRSGASFSRNNNSGFTVNQNGRLIFTIGAPITGAVGSNAIRIETGDGVIQDGVPYMVTANQPGDGGGIDLYINGVEQAVTRTIGGSQTLDSFVDAQADAGFTLNGPLNFNGYASGNTGGYSYFDNGQGLVQRPAVWRNNGGLTASQISDLHAAGNLTGPVTDYYEFIQENYVQSPDLSYCQMGWINGSAGTAEWGTPDPLGGGNLGRVDWNAPRLQTNTIETQRISRWRNYKSRFNNPFIGGQYTDGSGNQVRHLNDTVGTISMLVSHNVSVTIGQSAPLWSFGEGISGDDENVGIFFAGNTFGTSVVYISGQYNQSATTTGDFYRETVSAADADLALADIPAFTMITVTQDGTGVRVYVQDTERNTTVSSAGTAFTANGWFDEIQTFSADRMSVGYSGSTNHVGSLDVHHFIYLRRALSAAEVGELWDAVNGIF